MDNSELERKLRAGREPTLEPAYVEDFPRLVLANLNSARRETIRAQPSWRPRLAWALATAVCIIIAFAAGHRHGRISAGRDVLANSRVIDEALALFPNRVRAIVQDEHGLNLILSEQADVPASTPIYVRICDGQHCSSLVTFSGQEILLAGQKITVLSDANGGIILEGNKFVWSSVAKNQTGRGLNIRAKLL